MTPPRRFLRWLALSLTGCAYAATAGDWSMLGANAQHTFLSHDNAPANPAKVWETKLPGSVYASPVVHENHVYVATHGRRIWALERATGKVRWYHATSEAITATPAASGDTVVVAAKDGIVTALHTHTGTKKWQFKTDAKILASLTIADNTVYAASNDYFLYAVNLADGTLRWQYEVLDSRFGGLYAAPTLDREQVYVGAKNGILHAVSRQTGKAAWHAQLGSSMYDPPLLVDDRLYVGSYDNVLSAIDTHSGRIVWRRAVDDWPKGAPVLIDQTLYLATVSGELYGIEATSGKVVWQSSLGEELRHGFSVGRNRIGVIGTKEGRMLGLDLNTQQVVWERKLRGAIVAAPALADHTLFVVTFDGDVTAWR